MKRNLYLVLRVSLGMASAGVLLRAPNLAAAQYTIEILANFDGAGGSGMCPDAEVVLDAQGNIYGTTSGNYGGTLFDKGTLFKYSQSTNTLTTLVDFNGVNYMPLGRLVMDTNGHLYGTTTFGGSGVGDLFRYDTNTLTSLVAFGSFRGAYPHAGLTFDSQGNLYGTTSAGPANGQYWGVVFKYSPVTNAFTRLGVFTGPNGMRPDAEVVLDAQGNVYGTTYSGGTDKLGTVFKYNAQTSALSTLVSFNRANGASPDSALVLDDNGNLFGTTRIGGATGGGTLFKYSLSTGTLTTLSEFDTRIGVEPYGGLVLDSHGDLVGTTSRNGPRGGGTVFRYNLTESTLTTLFAFGTDAFEPTGVALDNQGNLYGTTRNGGTSGYGTLFKLTPIPEPSTLALLGIGAIGLLAYGWRRWMRPTP